MGRFYRTANPQKLDYIHKLPEEQLTAALLTKEGEIEKQEKALADLNGQLQFNALQKDEARRQEIISGYEKRIDAFAKQFQEDPLSFLDNRMNVRELSRDIFEDVTRGEAKKISSNYDLRTEYVKRYQEAVEKGDRILAKDFENAIAAFDRQYQGVNWNADLGTGNTYLTEELANYTNVEDIAEVRGEGYISDMVKQWGAYVQNGYIYSTEAMQETIPYEDIYSGVADAILNDQEVLDYYEQKIKFDPNFTQEDFTSIVHESASRVAQKYNKNHRASGTKSIKADPFELQKRRFAHSRAAAGAGETRKLLMNAAPNRNNEQFKYNIVAGDAKNTGEWMQNIAGLSVKATEPIGTFSENIGQIVKDNPNLNAGEKKQLLNELFIAEQDAVNGNFDKLEQIALRMNVGISISPEGGVLLSQNEGTGIEDLKKHYSKYTIESENQERILMTAMYDEIVGNREYSKMFDSEVKKAEQEKRNQIVNQNAAEGKFGVIIDESAYQLSEDERNDIMQRMFLNNPTLLFGLDEKVASSNFKISNESVFSTGGDYYDSKGVPPEEKAMFVKHLEKTSANFYDYLAKGQGVQVYVERTSENGQGKQIQQNINWDNLVQTGQFNYKQFEQIAKNPDGKHTITMTQEGKPVTFELGKMRVVPQDIPGIGRNSYQISMVGSDPKSGKPLSYTFYVPQNNLPASEQIQQFFKSREVDVMTDDLKRSAEMSFKNSSLRTRREGKTYYKSTDIPNVEYNPHFSDDKSGKIVPSWKFTDDNGNVRILVGEAGENAYKDLLRQSGYGDRYQSKMNVNYTTSKRQSASISTTTNK